MLAIVRIADGPILLQGSIDPEGELLLNAKLYDQTGVLLGDVDENRLNAVGNLCVGRPDLSTFLIQDFHRKELLYVHYLNRHAIEVRGALAYPGAPPLCS